MCTTELWDFKSEPFLAQPPADGFRVKLPPRRDMMRKTTIRASMKVSRKTKNTMRARWVFSVRSNAVVSLSKAMSCLYACRAGARNHRFPVRRKGTQAYAMPVCAPTRASILSGKHAARLHLTTWREAALETPHDQPLAPPPVIPG